MEKSDLRESKNLKELSKYIIKAISQKDGFLLWQNIEGQKVVSKGRIIHQVKDKTAINIELEVNSSAHISNKLKIFLFCEKGKILIKAKVNAISSNKITLKIIDKFYLEEQRLIKRYNLQDKEYFADIERSIEQKGKLKRERVQLKDISDVGLGFYITSNRAVFFQPDSVITFNAIEGVSLPTPLEGVIKHITPVDAKHDLTNKLLLVGVMFKEPFSQIDQVLQSVELNQIG